MRYGLYSDPEGRYSICNYAADQGWTAGEGIEDAMHHLERGDGWGLDFNRARDLVIHLLDFDSLPQLYSDHPELFI